MRFLTRLGAGLPVGISLYPSRKLDTAVVDRVQGPTTVIKYSEQGSIDKIHTVIRNPKGDYGVGLQKKSGDVIKRRGAMRGRPVRRTCTPHHVPHPTARRESRPRGAAVTRHNPVLAAYPIGVTPRVVRVSKRQ